MGMEKGIFRPGAGAVIQAFTVAVADGVIYSADWVELNTLVPTSQGVTAGEHEGVTLGSLEIND